MSLIKCGFTRVDNPGDYLSAVIYSHTVYDDIYVVMLFGIIYIR